MKNEQEIFWISLSYIDERTDVCKPICLCLFVHNLRSWLIIFLSAFILLLIPLQFPCRMLHKILCFFCKNLRVM